VKLAAYPFQKYGLMEGTVKTVSADSSIPGNGANNQRREEGEALPATPGLSFKALVELRDQKLATASDLMLPLAAGMQVSAEIMQGERTVMEYLLSPVKKVTDEAARER
jgi:HlyD family secretion protein